MLSIMRPRLQVYRYRWGRIEVGKRRRDTNLHRTEMPQAVATRRELVVRALRRCRRFLLSPTADPPASFVSIELPLGSADLISHPACFLRSAERIALKYSFASKQTAQLTTTLFSDRVYDASRPVDNVLP